MREILFRGKRLCNNKWMIGNLLCYENGEQYICCVNVRLNRYKVDPKTVGQFAGLTDKKGKKIFEGDIVKSVFNKQSYVVCFGEYVYKTDYTNEMHGFYLENTTAKYDVSPFGCSYNWAVIIGNIYDNPELLEGDNGR